MFNVSIDCGLSAAQVVGCGWLRVPEAVIYCIRHALFVSSYKFDYSPSFWKCLKGLKIERVKDESAAE